jgi:hypothetical protein
MALFKIKPYIAKILTKAITKAGAIPETEKKAQNSQFANADDDAKKLIAKIKSKADEKGKLYSQIILKVKSEAEEKISQLKSESSAEMSRVRLEAQEATDKERVIAQAQAQAAIDNIKAEYAEKEKSYEERMSQIEAEAEDVITALKIENDTKSQTYEEEIA